MPKRAVIFDDQCNSRDLQKAVVSLSEHEFELYAAESPGWIYSWMKRNDIWVVEDKDAIDVIKFIYTILSQLKTEQFTEPLVIILGQPDQSSAGFDLTLILRCQLLFIFCDSVHSSFTYVVEN